MEPVGSRPSGEKVKCLLRLRFTRRLLCGIQALCIYIVCVCVCVLAFKELIIWIHVISNCAFGQYFLWKYSHNDFWTGFLSRCGRETVNTQTCFCTHTHTNTCVQTKSQGSSARGVCQKAPEIISHSKQNPGTADRPWACTPEHSRQTAGTSLVAGAVGSGVRALGLKPTQTRLKLMSPSLDKPEPDWGCCCSHRAKCRGDYKGMYQRWGWTVDAEEWQEQISPKL